MTTLMSSILLGMGNFPFFAVLFTLPMLTATILRHKAVNFVRIGLNYTFLLYMLCVIALVLFPLPTPEQAALLHTHSIQLIPFHFIADIIKESPFRISNPATYIQAVFHETVLQVIFNVIMTIPFGMYLAYSCGCSRRKVIVCSFLFSFFIELTQLTGIYGIYHGSYRFCDVDDLMTNTLGGFIGYQLIRGLQGYIPAIYKFDLVVSKAKRTITLR